MKWSSRRLQEADELPVSTEANPASIGGHNFNHITESAGGSHRLRGARRRQNVIDNVLARLIDLGRVSSGSRECTARSSPMLLEGSARSR
jgi:hypothetical protein